MPVILMFFNTKDWYSCAAYTQSNW